MVVYLNLGGVCMAEASLWGSTEMEEGSYIGGAGFKREGILSSWGFNAYSTVLRIAFFQR